MAGYSSIDGANITGTASGTALTIIANIDSPDVIKTILLAAIGAIASFVVTILLKRLAARLKR